MQRAVSRNWDFVWFGRLDRVVRAVLRFLQSQSPPTARGVRGVQHDVHIDACVYTLDVYVYWSPSREVGRRRGKRERETRDIARGIRGKLSVDDLSSRRDDCVSGELAGGVEHQEAETLVFMVREVMKKSTDLDLRTSCA